MKRLTWKKFATYTLCMVTMGLSPAFAADVGVSDKIAKCFDGYTGIFVMRDTAGKTICEYNSSEASKGLSPNSTFKIALGLIGLETGVIKDENTVEKWDGSKNEVAETWNKDHDLKTAMSDSVNWYFHVVSKKIGKEKLAKYLKLLHYGNEDMSSGIEDFWMGSSGSLRITPKEQVDFLEKLYAEKLPLSPRSQQIMKKILKVDESPNAVLFGKTGTESKNGQLALGWFAGFVEGKNGNYVFATHLEGEKNVTGRKAREVTKKVLTEFGAW